MHFLPLMVPDEMQMTAVSASMMPWGAPGVMCGRGTTGAHSQPRLLISFEWPMHWLRTAEALSKQERELLQLQRLSGDQLLATGTVPFLNLQPGDDPPDAVGVLPEGSVAIECTTLGIQQRREAYGLFSRIRKRLLMVPNVHLSRLAGHVIYVWFDDAVGRPFARSDDEAAEDLVRQLVEHEPAGEDLWVPHAENMPETAPPIRMITTQSGARFYCVPLVNAAPDTVLFALRGIELGLCLTTVHDAEPEWQSLQATVHRKDREGVEWLVISAGAPDQHGRLFPAEEVLADFLLEHPADLPVPKHLKRVTLHFWSTGRAVDLWPSFGAGFGPLYQGVAPSHQPLLPTHRAEEVSQAAEAS